jgi:hypothetical protein
MRSIIRGVIGVVLIGSIRGCGRGWNFHGDAWRWWNMSWRLVLWDLVLEDAHRIYVFVADRIYTSRRRPVLWD